jgi:glycosyltransferase involved in cell wall biosynthesis
MVKNIQLKMEYKYIGFDGHYGGDEYEKVLCEKIQSNFPNINFTKKTVKRKGGIKSVPGLMKLLIFGQFYKGIIIRPFGLPIFRKNMTVILHHYDQSGSPYYTKILEYTDRLGLKLLSKILNLKFITVSKHWSDWVKANFNERSYIIYNDVEINFDNTVDKSYLAKKYNLDAEKRWVFLGGKHPKKGGSLVIKNLLKTSNDNLQNIQLIQTGSNLKNENKLSVIRWIESVDYLSFLNSCDVVIANSQFNEGWCRILHEAALLDVAVAGSGRGGMGELLELTNGKSGYTIEELTEIVLANRYDFKPNISKLNELKKISDNNLRLWIKEIT